MLLGLPSAAVTRPAHSGCTLTHAQLLTQRPCKGEPHRTERRVDWAAPEMHRGYQAGPFAAGNGDSAQDQNTFIEHRRPRQTKRQPEGTSAIRPSWCGINCAPQVVRLYAPLSSFGLRVQAFTQTYARLVRTTGTFLQLAAPTCTAFV